MQYYKRTSVGRRFDSKMAAVGRGAYESKILKATTSTDDYIFISEWLTENDSFYAIGRRRTDQRQLCKFKAPFKSGLFVWAQTSDDLCILSNIKYLDFCRKTDEYDDMEFQFDVTGISAIERLINCTKAQTGWKMFKIPTKSFWHAKSLYDTLNDSENVACNNYIKTTGVWTIETFIMLEMYLKHRNWNKCCVYSVFLNKQLDLIDTELLKYNTVSFDIETVSHEPHRLPTGEHKTDVIFSASLTVLSQTAKIHHTLLNIPCKDRRAIDYIKIEEQYDFDPVRKVSIVNNERDLLRQLCAILDAQRELFILLGYNSKNYDMMFIARRLVYLNMPEANNIYCQNGILIYGCKMIHIDMYLVISKYYANELKSFQLKAVCKECLEDSEKVDMDARDLRYVYKHIIDHGIGDGVFANWNVTLSKIAHYNDVDSLLVSKLWIKLGYDTFLLNVSKNYKISLSRLGQSYISEYLSNKILLDSFKHNVLFTQHHNKNVAFTSDAYLSYNNEKLSSSDGTCSFGGGFNYRDSKNVFDKVHMMDMVAYYPQLIEGFNLSHETVSIVTVGLLRVLRNRRLIDFKDSDVSMYRFCTHRALKGCRDHNELELYDEDVANVIESRNYINGSLDNASRISIADLDHLAVTDRLIIILQSKVGILSKIMAHQNWIRNAAKETKRMLNETKQQIDTLIMRSELGDLDDFFDPDDYEDDTDTGDDFQFQEDKYLLDNLLEEDDDEDLLLVKSRLKLITTQAMTRFTVGNLKRYKDMVLAEFSRINSQYRNLKIVNSSFYGLVGSTHGLLRGRHVAATATLFGRKFIIETAQTGQSIGCRVILIDTDSTFFVPAEHQQSSSSSSSSSIDADCIETIKAKLQSINGKLVLSEKVYSHVFVIAKKTYFATYNEPFSRGINKNGPRLWSDVMYMLYEKFIINKTEVTLKSLPEILNSIYTFTYEKLTIDKTLILCKINVKDVTEYKTATPVEKLMLRLRASTPTQVFGRSVNYFFQWLNSPKTVHLGIDYELDQTPISMLNLYKFYSKIHMSMYHILSMALIEANKKRGIYYTLNIDEFNKINCNEFIIARNTFIQTLQ